MATTLSEVDPVTWYRLRFPRRKGGKFVIVGPTQAGEPETVLGQYRTYPEAHAALLALRPKGEQEGDNG